MSWYDHATMMVFRLGRWAEAPALRPFEVELAARQEQMAADKSDSGPGRCRDKILPIDKK